MPNFFPIIMPFSLFIHAKISRPFLLYFGGALYETWTAAYASSGLKTIRRENFVVLNRSKLSKEVSRPKPEPLLMQVLDLKEDNETRGIRCSQNFPIMHTPFVIMVGPRKSDKRRTPRGPLCSLSFINFMVFLENEKV